MNKRQMMCFICICSIASACCENAIKGGSSAEKEAFVLPPTPFRYVGDPSLQKTSAPVPLGEILSAETQAVIDRMFEVARGERNEGQASVMVGLAAPQIGIDKRIILVDRGVDSDSRKLGELAVYINPEILSYSDEMEEGKEGCYSVDSRIVGNVRRPRSIQIKAFDREGAPITAELTDFTARIFQHEVDHLNGIRFPDLVGPEGRLDWVEEREYGEYRSSSANWSCQCPGDVWVAMKKGSAITGDKKEAPCQKKD